MHYATNKWGGGRGGGNEGLAGLEYIFTWPGLQLQNSKQAIFSQDTSTRYTMKSHYIYI